MMLDKKGRIFGKVSIIDLLVILILILAIVGGMLAFQKISDKKVLTENKGLVQTQTELLEVSMRLEEVRMVTVESISEGDEVYSVDTGKYFGTIKNIAVEPATRLIYDLKGRSVLSIVPERYDAILTVEVPGSRLESGYFTADNIHLVYGSSMTIKTTTIITNPIIETITPVVSD